MPNLVYLSLQKWNSAKYVFITQMQHKTHNDALTTTRYSHQPIDMLTCAVHCSAIAQASMCNKLKYLDLQDSGADATALDGECSDG